MSRHGTPRPVVVIAAHRVEQAVAYGEPDGAEAALRSMRSLVGDRPRTNERELWEAASRAVAELLTVQRSVAPSG